MQTYIETPLHLVTRDRLGHYLVISKATSKSAYFQGDDSRALESEIEHRPMTKLDSVLAQYESVMTA